MSFARFIVKPFLASLIMAVCSYAVYLLLGGINAGRLQLHRNKINAKYTIIVAPYYKPSVESDIAHTVNVMITASSLSNFLYQYSIHCKDNMSYKPLYDMVQAALGTDITSTVNEYVSSHFGIGKSR